MDQMLEASFLILLKGNTAYFQPYFYPSYWYNVKPHNSFFNVLCVFETQLQNPLFFLEPLTSLVLERVTNWLPLTFPLTLQKGFSGSGGLKNSS